jgi:hypothetical protein
VKGISNRQKPVVKAREEKRKNLPTKKKTVNSKTASFFQRKQAGSK